MSKSGAMCPSAATSETTDETTGVGEPPAPPTRALFVSDWGRVRSGYATAA
jgi:hypothetical protein